MDGATEIRVRLPGETEPTAAELVGAGHRQRPRPAADRRRRPEPVTFAPTAEVGLGDEVLAIGFALDLDGEPTVTLGIVSAARPHDHHRQRCARRADPDRRGDLVGQLRRPPRRRRRPDRRHQHGRGPQRRGDGGDQRRVRHLRRRGRVGARQLRAGRRRGAPAPRASSGSPSTSAPTAARARCHRGRRRLAGRRGRHRGRRRRRLHRRRRRPTAAPASSPRSATTSPATRSPSSWSATASDARSTSPSPSAPSTEGRPTRSVLDIGRNRPESKDTRAGCGAPRAPLASPPCAWGRVPGHGTEHFATDVRVRLADAARDRTATTQSDAPHGLGRRSICTPSARLGASPCG